MKHLQIALTLVLAAGLSMGAVSPALASGLAWAEAQALPNPSLANGPVFLPAAATAGVAVVSARADGPLKDCSQHNPCAIVTPARDDVAVAPQKKAAFEAIHLPRTELRHVPAGTADLHS